MKSHREYADKNSNFSSEEGGSIFLRNVVAYLTTQKTKIKFVIQALYGNVGTAPVFTSAETL
jgi:hypothetical protein